MKMLAISLHQPYASLLLTPINDPVKLHETRDMRPQTRVLGQRVAIHASKAPIDVRQHTDDLIELCAKVFGLRWDSTLPLGYVVGSAVISGYRRVDMPAEMLTTPDDITCGDWSPGRVVWRMVEPRILLQPIPCRGMPGFFEVEMPDDS